MRSKLNLKWFFSIILMLGLFVNNSKAQLNSVIQDRDKVYHITRALFIQMNNNMQVDFLTNSRPFIVDDLINASATDMLTATPSLIFYTQNKFYNELTITDQQQVLRRPEIYKIYH